MEILDIILNICIFGITAYVGFTYFRKDHHWDVQRGKSAFRYFTCLSNNLCATVSLLTACARIAGSFPDWVFILKYIGTAGVTVTMMTVLLLLAPSLGKGGLKRLLAGTELFMHLINPLMAVVTFLALEHRGMSLTEALWGLLPVVLYGPWYLYKVVYAPEGKRWDDFYGFNRIGKWPLFFSGMLISTIGICALLWAGQNL